MIGDIEFSDLKKNSMKNELLEKLEEKIDKAANLINELRSEKEKFSQNTDQIQQLQSKLETLEQAKKIDINNNLQRETLIRTKIEELIRKLSILGPLEN